MIARENAMRIFKICIGGAIAMGLVAAGFAHANVDNAGQTAAGFLTTGAGPRILGMGGATLGLGDDVTGGAWNPAALGWASRNEFVISHVGLSNETTQDWIGFGGRLGTTDTRWALSGLYRGEGTIEGRDASNNPTSDISASSMAFGAHLAQRFGGLTVGLGAKTVLDKLGDVSGFGFTFDGGAMYRTGMFGVGVAGQNIGGQMRYNSIVYQFPASVGVGVAVCPPGTGLRFALDANFPKAYYTDVRAGVEYLWRDMVAVRAGYRHELSDVADALTTPTFGLGAGRSGFWFDYGYVVGTNGDAEHRVGLRLVPGSLGSIGGMFGYNDPSRPAEPMAAARPEKARPPKVAAPRREPVAQAVAKPKPVKTPKSAKAEQVAKADRVAKAAPKRVVESAAKTEPLAVATPAPAATRSTKKNDAPRLLDTAPPRPAEENLSQATAPAEKPREPAKAPPRPKSVKVGPGETLDSIAERWGTSPAAIMMENNMVSDVVRVGQTLRLPRR
jgi:LysM repeat protein